MKNTWWLTVIKISDYNFNNIFIEFGGIDYFETHIVSLLILNFFVNPSQIKHVDRIASQPTNIISNKA